MRSVGSRRSGFAYARIGGGLRKNLVSVPKFAVRRARVLWPGSTPTLGLVAQASDPPLPFRAAGRAHRERRRPRVIVGVLAGRQAKVAAIACARPLLDRMSDPDHVA